MFILGLFSYPLCVDRVLCTCPVGGSADKTVLKIQAPVLRKFVVHTRFQHSGGRTKDRYFRIFRVIESVGTNQLVAEAQMAPYRI